MNGVHGSRGGKVLACRGGDQCASGIRGDGSGSRWNCVGNCLAYGPPRIGAAPSM